jgi:Flp pilus assembly protein TadG
MPGSRVHQLLRDRRGVTIVEFSLVAAPLILLIFGILETGWQLATAAALDHAALAASRFGITGAAGTVKPTGSTVPCRSASIRQMVTSSTGGFLNQNNLTITITSYSNTNTAAQGKSGTSGAGTGGQVVTYALTYQQPYLLGGIVPFFTGTAYTHSATIIVKNEPFSNATC